MFRYPLIALLLAADGDGCASAEPEVEVPTNPTVYTSGASRGVFEDGVLYETPCAEFLGDGATDYTSCCATGFGPVGLTAGGDVVCLEMSR